VNEKLFEVQGLKFHRGTGGLKQPLNFSLSAGQWCALMGENGSGKTTLLRILCGLSEPACGVVRWRGVPLKQNRGTYHRAFIYIGHKLGFRGGLDIEENLKFYCNLRGGEGDYRLNDAMAYFGMGSVAKQAYASLSRGQQQRAALCRLITERSELWLLDEPTSALDKQGQEIFRELLEKHLAEGGIAVIATHKQLGHGLLPTAYQLELQVNA